MEGFDVGAEDDLFGADGGAQREAGGGLSGDHAGVRGGVARDDDVADVFVFHGAVGIEDGNQPIGGGLGGEEGGIRADGVAFVFETMANGAVGFEQERAVLGVAFEFPNAGVTGDDFGAVGVDFAEELGGARAEGGVGVFGKFLAMRGADLVGGQIAFLERSEKGLRPRGAGEKGFDGFGADGGAEGFPTTEQCADQMRLVNFSQRGEGGFLKRGRVLGGEQFDEGFFVGIDGFEAAGEEGDGGLPLSGGGVRIGGGGAGVFEKGCSFVESGFEFGRCGLLEIDESLAAGVEGVEEAGQDGEVGGGEVIEHEGEGVELFAGGGEFEKVVGKRGGRAGFLGKDLFQHRGGVRGSGAFDGELKVGIFGMLHGEVNEAFGDELAFALAEGKGELAEDAGGFVGEALAGEGFIAAFA